MNYQFKQEKKKWTRDAREQGFLQAGSSESRTRDGKAMEIYWAQTALSETGFGVVGSAAGARPVKGPECAAPASGTGGQGRRSSAFPCPPSVAGVLPRAPTRV